MKELEIDMMETTMRTRIAYGEASVLGLGAYEYKDPKAKEEATSLANEVLTVLKNL